jgi:hypothetical protein
LVLDRRLELIPQHTVWTLLGRKDPRPLARSLDACGRCHLRWFSEGRGVQLEALAGLGYGEYSAIRISLYRLDFGRRCVPWPWLMLIVAAGRRGRLAPLQAQE